MPNVIVLDPGHQDTSADTGAQGNGLREQDITLAICREIRALLQYNTLTTVLDVVMTRDGDFVGGPHSTQFESLQTRVNIAEKVNADLFVSVHINTGGGTGTEVLISGTGGRAEVAAKKVLSRLIQACGWANRGVKVQNVHVLRETSMPAILTENGFIDSISDSAKLKDSAFLQKIAVAHAKGICDYFGITYMEKPPTAPPTPPTTPLDPDVNLVVWCPASEAIKAIKGINSLGYYVEQFPLKLRRD